ncbi:MAG: hypothetical protein OEL83_06210 [Desulforhopalus sp.]|nr:hypothetical protein [Desulforhopalus sp.]
MKKLVLSALLVITPLCVASLSFSQGAAAPADCQQTLKNNCTKCHGLPKICAKLGDKAADWPAIVARMGDKAKLSKEVQDAALACLSKSPDPAKLGCEAK